MNLNATPATVRAITQVFKLAGILDDRAPHPDKARVAAWSEQVQRHRLDEQDLLDGLQSFYDLPQDRPIAIGDLIQHAKAGRRNRLDREDDQAREDRRTAVDIKAAEDTAAVAAGFISGPVAVKTPRLIAAETALQCCVDKASAQAAIAEFFAAKRAAKAGQQASHQTRVQSQRGEQ